MSNSTWISLSMQAPPANRTVFVCDQIGGPQYSARWDRTYGWQVMSFPAGYTPASRPSFWLYAA
jgi:hypothetical protein